MKKSLTILTFSLASALFAQDPSQEPEMLASLRDSYQAAIARATSPLTKTYITELERLRTDFTKKGELRAALAVDAELKTLTTSTPTPLTARATPPDDPADLASSLPGSVWLTEKPDDWLKGFTFIDGTKLKMEESNGKEGIYDYTIEGKDKVKFKFTTGTTNVLEFDRKARKMTLLGGRKIELERQ